ncbi:transglutaminase-like domain-containing protein [Lederbergia sp. NSJ-179]|uniref:transglutaminase-like domain-containing protein n=1 Tax=Lederbergia sp. NSJ-179 TaxID=2931402 RepID=UPI001FD2F9A8|nr:transglutaminase-like domain-containing protein [Lederbergia sp. NSJ-179]MCJ7841390.1 transglutaminase-like domain-containing protein [Lederbergia sp. NSJ-179]
MSQQTRWLTLDDKTKWQMEEKFQYKRELAKGKEKELFGILNEAQTEDEKRALTYLLAYMPLNDLADYDGALFLNHIREAFHIQSVVPWGERVPASLFLHFILPYRINNENIEDIRGVFFDEIYPRVQDLSMADAILETNHWCHEKANYIGNDPRTVSPLTLIRTALGRCGEQSTLAVAALRSIGIPARQVYTPLWAHSDSNHAWVEAWADGKWYFFGACEPEPKLNQGWFENPAKRAMLIHTKVGANYNGPEAITLAHPWYSELNLTNLYADTKTIQVRITDEEGQPTQAKVQFQLFNFGGLRNILVKETDEQGTVALTLGLGDVYISAYSAKGWGFGKCAVKTTDGITISLTKEIPVDIQVDFKMVPPSAPSNEANIEVTAEERQKHNDRVKTGTNIRASYEATFLTEEDARKLADECSLPKTRVWEVLKKARGNSHEIAAFLKEYSKPYKEWSLRLLEVLNEKDLTDTFRPTLADHLIQAMIVKDSILPELDDELFAQYILRPRVDFEMLTSYRSYFLKEFGVENVEAALNHPHFLIDFLDREFEVVEGVNYFRGSATPIGSFKLKKGDTLSRDILFVALARTIGIPARLEPSDKRPQYMMDGSWKNVQFRDGTIETKAADIMDQIGFVLWEKDEHAAEPIKYGENVTIARFEKGSYQSLFFKFDEAEQQKLALPAGYYRLTTSIRLNDGTALIRFRYFQVKANEDTTVPLQFPKHVYDVPVIAEANLDYQAEAMDGTMLNGARHVGAKGTTFVWIEPDREPSKHLLRELREMKAEWEALDVQINGFIREEKWGTAQQLQAAGDLPNNMMLLKETTSEDSLNTIGQAIPADKKVGNEWPIVYVVDENQQIRHISEGYKLGISKEVFDVYKQISE